jgi:phosphotransferase system enzyme I (PtsI)
VSGSSAYRNIYGISAAPGVGIGRAFVYKKGAPTITRRRIGASQVEAEIERFLYTLHLAGDEIRRIRRMVAAEQGEELAQIFDAQLAMLEDIHIKEQTQQWIREKNYSAEHAFSVTLQEMKKAFREIENEYLRARVSDVADIENQVLMRLAGSEVQGLQATRSNTIIFAYELLPSEMVQLERRQIKGVVLDVGGTTSHAAIIARSLRLPIIVGTGNSSQRVKAGELAIVDGNEGVVHVQPSDAMERDYRALLRRQLRRQRDLDSRSDLPAQTRDGSDITLLANIDIPTEIQTALDHGARGVGMYRTEFLYLSYRLPSEEEQYQAYVQIVRAISPDPVTIRTIDLGGDKLSHVLDVQEESNPFLGWRGIRICLDEPVLFKTQLRALLRAGCEGKVQILLPMISEIRELTQACALLEEAKEELRASGQAFQEDCKVGIMVEVPSVAIMIDQFAIQADFLSLGTNDLTQYVLAVDRGTSRVANLYDPFHPAVLRLIKMVADGGERYGKPVSICGEMAGDPLATILLIGLGLSSLSLSPGLIPEVKEIIRATTSEQARHVAEKCLGMATGDEVCRYLEEIMGEVLPFWRRTSRRE